MREIGLLLARESSWLERTPPVVGLPLVASKLTLVDVITVSPPVTKLSRNEPVPAEDVGGRGERSLEAGPGRLTADICAI